MASTSRPTSHAHCCVPFCKGDGRYNRELCFHKFPKDKNRRKIWIVRIKRDEGQFFKVTNNTTVCSRHFIPSDYRGNVFGPNRGKLLKPDVFPTVFDWSKTVKRRVNVMDKIRSRMEDWEQADNGNGQEAGTPEGNSGTVVNKKEAAAAKEKQKKLSKRLAYLLRYGAEKEGLAVNEGGYVNLMDLLKVPLLRHHTPYEVLQEIEGSTSYTGLRRFEKKHECSLIYVRAVYGRRMERNPLHDDCKVQRLLELCLTRICDNLKDYDLQDFPDEFLVNTIIHKLRTKQRLNNTAFRVLLGSTIEHLDLGSVYMTEATMKLVASRCPHLKVLNLRMCGYAVNDHYMEMMLKKLKEIESLNVSGCRHLSDRTAKAIVKNCINMEQLNLTHVPDISEEAILNLLVSLPKLHHLDIYDNPNVTAQGKEVIEQCIKEKNIKVKLEGLNTSVEDENGEDASLTLALAGVSKFW